MQRENLFLAGSRRTPQWAPHKDWGGPHPKLNKRTAPTKVMGGEQKKQRGLEENKKTNLEKRGRIHGGACLEFWVGTKDTARKKGGDNRPFRNDMPAKNREWQKRETERGTSTTKNYTMQSVLEKVGGTACFGGG